jgi:alginate O-acetyltransferase complex protein AlgI
MEDAMRVLGGMVNFGSVSRRVQDIPTEALAWGGGPVIDGLFLILPNSMVATTASYAAILFALMVCAQKNSFQLAANGISSKKLAGALVMIVASLYLTLASTSSVFLYFNF